MLTNIRKAVSVVVCFFIMSLSAQPCILHEEWLSPDIDLFDCHSSTLIETSPGKICAIWKGGPGDGLSNIDLKTHVGLWISHYNGEEWSSPQEIVRSPFSVCWNPVLTQLLSGELLLFYRMGPDPRQAVSLLKRSHDGGMSWSLEEILPAGITGPTKNHPIVTPHGALICPSSIGVGSPDATYKTTACWIEMSDDAGRHWKKYGPIEIPGRKFGPVEPALFYNEQGLLCMVCRDRANKENKKGFIQMAVSSDGGMTWSPFRSTGLPNPDAGIDAVDLGHGKILLVYNHSDTNRFPLSLSLSIDGGNSWSQPYTIEKTSGEMPSALLTADGYVHITYACNPPDKKQRRIKHIVIDPDLLKFVNTHEKQS